MGRPLILAGAALLVLGLLVSVNPSLFHWFGRLPGDIRIKGENGVIFIPLTSMLLLSAAATILLNLFFHR